MTTVNERQEKLAAEKAYKEHIHHTKIGNHSNKGVSHAEEILTLFEGIERT